MSAKDRWARLTPYEVGIPGRDFADRVFRQIREEADTRGVDTTDPGAFILLGEVGRAIREIQGEERGREAIQTYGAFLFHAFHFHGEGERLLLIAEDAARHLVEGAFEDGPWEGRLPSSAGYVQLPRHLFWSASGEGATPEPVDGFFWTLSTGGTLSLLLALGVREGRPGISVIEVPPVDLGQARRWPVVTAREEGEDFATHLPGGDLDGLYSLETIGEAVKLAARTFAYLETSPEAMGAEETAPARDGSPEDAGAARPSALSFRRIALVPTNR